MKAFRNAAVLALAAILSVGCAGEQETAPASPAARTFNSVHEMREAIEAAGILCDYWRVFEGDETSREFAWCAADLVFFIHPPGSTEALFEKILRGPLGGTHMVGARGWSVNCSSGNRCSEVQAAFGGKILIPPPRN